MSDDEFVKIRDDEYNRLPAWADLCKKGAGAEEAESLGAWAFWVYRESRFFDEEIEEFELRDE